MFPCDLVTGTERTGSGYDWCNILVGPSYNCMEPSVTANIPKYARCDVSNVYPVLSTTGSTIKLVQHLFV